MDCRVKPGNDNFEIRQRREPSVWERLPALRRFLRSPADFDRAVKKPGAEAPGFVVMANRIAYIWLYWPFDQTNQTYSGLRTSPLLS